MKSYTIGLQISQDLEAALQLLAERQKVNERINNLAKRLKLIEPKDKHDAVNVLRNWASQQILGQFVKDE